uniref:zinc finger protein 282-like isoform X2 n=1 Tax=Podarcis muralis TaxID=64176 RepID=UPI00109F287E|nr:zinc finger protein 282-like isoform X2 [Podarcis muralis]
MAEWPLSAQSSRWSSEVPAAPVVDAAFPKELQTATISLWTVVGAVQAVERTVEAQALRLLSLEQRSEMAEKRFGDCEKAVAELGTQLDSRWSALETLLQEYGQLQKRLETMEDLLKNGNFWFLKVPVNAAAAASKVSAASGDGSAPFSREKWERLEDWQRELYKNVAKGNGESLISLDLAVSKLENFTCAPQEDAPHILGQKNSEECAQEPLSDSKTESSISRTDIISWIKQEEELCTKGNGQDGVLSQSTCNWLPASRSDEVPWVKQEETPAGRDGGNGLQSTCNANATAQPHPEEAQSEEDPANPPLLLFLPGGSVAPILNGTIGESRPLPGLRGARNGRHPGSPSARGTPEAAVERPHRCADCGKTFSLLLSLQMHQMNHQKRKQYECSFCGTAFSSPSELVRHRMIHTGERPYRCSVCGKGFVRKQHLVPHLRLHTGERPYHCAECGKDFICKHHLQEHQRTHTGERPYACAQCGKRFRRKKSLKDHWRVHSAEEQQQKGQAGSARVPEGTEGDVREES